MTVADPASGEDADLAGLRLVVQRQAADLQMVAEAIDQMETTFRNLPTAALAAGSATPDPPADAPAPFDFATLYTWVHTHIATITERKVSKGSSESGTAVRWCTRWYEHDEAVARLEALRRAWEEHVVQPGASMSSWYLTHYDPHLTALTAPGGPFWQCSPGHHQPARTLGHELLDNDATADPRERSPTPETMTPTANPWPLNPRGKDHWHGG